MHRSRWLGSAVSSSNFKTIFIVYVTTFALNLEICVWIQLNFLSCYHTQVQMAKMRSELSRLKEQVKDSEAALAGKDTEVSLIFISHSVQLTVVVM
jgi:hypothetical protein